jgi:hypothetical protein
MKSKKEKINKIKISLIAKILEILQGGAETSLWLFDVMASSYHESYRKLKRDPMDFKTDWADWYRERQKFYSSLNRLKRDGLVQKKEKLWEITKRGLQYLDTKQKKILKDKLALKVKKTNRLIIVSYDIPEIYKKERAWTREILEILGFQMVHKSVWVAKAEIPEEFLIELRKKKLFDFFHIFEVKKTGTLKEID